MVRKVFPVSLDTSIPAEVEFMEMAASVPRGRRQEWVRLVLRAGISLYKQNLGKPGFDGFHKSTDNLPMSGTMAPPISSARSEAASEVRVRPGAPSPSSELVSQKEHPLRGMFEQRSPVQS